MSNEVLTHEMAILIRKLIGPADFEHGKREKISSVEEISQGLGIRLNTVNVGLRKRSLWRGLLSKCESQLILAKMMGGFLWRSYAVFA